MNHEKQGSFSPDLVLLEQKARVERYLASENIHSTQAVSRLQVPTCPYQDERSLGPNRRCFGLLQPLPLNQRTWEKTIMQQASGVLPSLAAPPSPHPPSRSWI